MLYVFYFAAFIILLREVFKLFFISWIIFSKYFVVFLIKILDWANQLAFN